MLRYSIVLLAALFAAPSSALFKHNTFTRSSSTQAKTQPTQVEVEDTHERIMLGDYTESYFQVAIDHFTSNGSSPNYTMRFLLDESFAVGVVNPPILFYCGNEGGVVSFYNNSGFMTKNLSAELKAVVLFGEHRYYGKSMPFGNDSFSKDNVKYLTVDQTLMDYVKLIKSFKANNTNYANSPVYAFGGSYGGMLAAWFRMKYPHIIQGSHAASAPILFFPGSVSPYAFNQLTARTYRAATTAMENYDTIIQDAFLTLQSMGANTGSWGVIQSVFTTCRNIKSYDDVYYIMGAISGSTGTMAMVNYPYETNFTAPLPANPVSYAVGKAVTQVGQPRLDKDKLTILQIINNVYSNYTGQQNCTPVEPNPNGGNDDSKGWDYQVCNEMVMPIAQSGKQFIDMYWPEYWDSDAYINNCIQTTGLKPQFNWALDTFGGRNPKKDFMHISNIIFTNGDLDPWRAGGLTYNLTNTDNVTVHYMAGGAHHLDLREPNDDKDPADVKIARADVKAKLVQWTTNWAAIKLAKTELSMIELPVLRLANKEELLS